MGLDRFRSEEGDDTAFKRAVREEFGLTGLAGADADTLEDALEILANGRVEATVERLTDRFGSVCETDVRAAHDRGDGQTAACHLYRDDLGESEPAEPGVESALGGVDPDELASGEGS